jgi:hypothetical protein
VPLQPAQAQGTINASGIAVLILQPQGTGSVWYPTQVTVSTSSGVNDVSTFQLYIGPGVLLTTVAGTQLVGTLFPGGMGTIALAIPYLTPGWGIIGVWMGAKVGDIAAMNVVGTMDALVMGPV